MNIQVTNTSIHSQVLSLIDQINHQQQISLQNLVNLIPQGTLDPANQSAAQNSALQIGYRPTLGSATFDITIPPQGIEIKVGAGSLSIKSQAGTLSYDPNSVSMVFPDGPQSPRGKYLFIRIRLEEILLTSTKVTLIFDKAMYTINH